MKVSEIQGSMIQNIIKATHVKELEWQLLQNEVVIICNVNCGGGGGGGGSNEDDNNHDNDDSQK